MSEDFTSLRENVALYTGYESDTLPLLMDPIEMKILAHKINDDLLSLGDARELADTIESHLDHGWGHFRRVKKMYDEILSNSPELTSDETFMTYILPSYLAVRLHDFVEVATGQKKGHDEAAAAFSLVYLSSIKNTVVGETISPEEWDKVVWSTAYICRYHSRPEDMPTADTLLSQGLLDVPALYKKTDEVFDRAAKQKRAFPLQKQYVQLRQQFDQQGLIQPNFSPEEIQAIRQQTLTFAAADKLDVIFPPETAANRMFLTVPDRQLYKRSFLLLDGTTVNFNSYEAMRDWIIGNDSDLKRFQTYLATNPQTDSLQQRFEEMVLEKEYELRKQGGGGAKSLCDLDRMIFELSRKTFQGISPWVEQVFAQGQFRKANYYLNGVAELLEEGNIDEFLTGYDAIEQETLIGLLEANEIQYHTELFRSLGDLNDYRKLVRLILKDENLDTTRVDVISHHIAMERGAVLSALEGRHKAFLKLDCSEKERLHIRGLLELVLKQSSKTKLGNNFWGPGWSYYPVTL